MEVSHRVAGESDDLNDQIPSETWGDDEDEELDPRVQDELEALNSAAESINKLENEVQRARAKFRLMKAESTQKLQALSKKTGHKWIIKARLYYDLVAQSQKAQQEAQKAAIKYQKANSFYKAAKETVTLAEQQVVMEDGAAVKFDSAWQEMLNHATMKFMDAEKEKAMCELDHEQRAKDYAGIQQKLNFMLKDMPRTINRAKAFYELKEILQSRLQAERQNAEDLHLALICSKQKYKMALKNLENISEEVHRNRRLRLQVPIWRTPGVGAESDAMSEMSDMPSVNLDFMSETASQVSFDDFSEDGSWSPQLDVDLALDDDLPEPEPPHAVGGHSRKTSDASGIGQIFARLSKITQDIGKASSTNDKPDEAQSVPVSNNHGMIRDDTVDGAEDRSMSEQAAKGVRSLGQAQRRMGRSQSCERLVMQQMSVVNLGAPDSSESPTKVTGKPPLPSAPRRMSVSALKSGVYVTQSSLPQEKAEPPKFSVAANASSEAPSQDHPILYDLKSTNQKAASSSWKPVSFLQNLQAHGRPDQPRKQGAPMKATGKFVPAGDNASANGSKNLNTSKSPSDTELKRAKGEEIFV